MIFCCLSREIERGVELEEHARELGDRVLEPEER
jgi:hypothetical protein